MSDQGLSIPINSRTITIFITMCGIVFGIVGTWYINNEKVKDLEATVAELKEKRGSEAQEVNDLLSKRIDKLERTSKERAEDMKEDYSNGIQNVQNKVDQIEGMVHDTQLTVGTISQDIKNIGGALDEIKHDIRSLRESGE